MTTLNLPYTVTAGSEENINQVMSNFRAIETWANNDIDDTNMASGYSRLAAYSPERELFTQGYGISGITTTTVPLEGAATDVTFGLIKFDPADYAVSGRTLKLRLRVVLFTNNTAPGITFTAGLHPVTASGGATGPTVAFGTAVASVSFTTPGANSANVSTAEIVAPGAGTYALGVVGSGSQAANSYIGGTSQVMVYFA